MEINLSVRKKPCYVLAILSNNLRTRKPFPVSLSFHPFDPCYSQPQTTVNRVVGTETDYLAIHLDHYVCAPVDTRTYSV